MPVDEKENESEHLFTEAVASFPFHQLTFFR